MTILAIVLVALVMIAMRQSIAAQRKAEQEEKLRRHVRREYGGGE